MVQEHIFDTGTVTINYAEEPASGAPLVLIHGGSARWQALAGVIPDFAERWHVYALDLRGHGKSGHVPGRYRLQDYADDLAAFLQHVTGPAILIGHSLGGMVAVMLAGQHPDLVRALVVGDAPLARDTWRRALEQQDAQLHTWRHLAGPGRSEIELVAALKEIPVVWGEYTTPVPARIALGEDSPWFEAMVANLHALDPDMLTALVDDFEQTVAGYDLHALLPAITCPVLLLQADPALAGSALTSAEVDQALALLPDATHVQLRGQHHGSVVQPECVCHFLEQRGLVL
jgi:pimeloyl-ACP methyl ester carboxylesterase